MLSRVWNRCGVRCWRSVAVLAALLSGLYFAQAVADGGKPLKIDVSAAVAATLGAQDDPDAVQLPGFVVQHKRSITNLLPCLGCTGRPKVPMHLLLDLADSVNSLFVVPVAKRPDDPADGSRQWAHFYMCLPDNPLGCAQSPQDP